jgi:hypothetical protein
VIDRAKGLLMQRQGLTEQAAYEKLRKTAMDKGSSWPKWRSACWTWPTAGLRSLELVRRTNSVRSNFQQSSLVVKYWPTCCYYFNSKMS